MARIHFCQHFAALLLVSLASGTLTNEKTAPAATHVIAEASPPVPIIIDTDIGGDFDDSAALAFAVNNPRVDVKMVLTATGDTTERAKLVGKYLTEMNRDDIPIGIGVVTNHTAHMFGWSTNFDLKTYSGGVFEDGIGKAIDIIKSSDVNITIVAIAAMTNFPPLMQRYPDVIRKASVCAMSGSIYRGYKNSTTPSAESNVKLCPACTAQVYKAPWTVTITPVDTSGQVVLSGLRYDSYLIGTSQAARVLAQSQIYWSRYCPWGKGIVNATSTWYDPVAVYLSTGQTDLLVIKELSISVTADGHTIVDPAAHSYVQVALQWSDLDEFEDNLADCIADPQGCK